MILGSRRVVSWPRQPPALTEAQLAAREKFMQLWHEILPHRYQALEAFNHGWVAKLPRPDKCRTLEIGAGLGGHLPFENLDTQDYYCLELRPSFCDALKKKLGAERVIQGDIQMGIASDPHIWDRIIAIHTLEHLRDLPAALKEVKRLLSPQGVFDVVIPCEGGLAYNLARRISSQRVFESNFKMSYTPIIKNEHVSEYPEIVTLLQEHFDIERYRFFPFLIPFYHPNLVVGFRLQQKKTASL